jgi:UPF0755 protein
MKFKDIFQENKVLTLSIILIVIFLSFFYVPTDFPVNHIVSIPNGANLKQITDILKEENVIHSKIFFNGIVAVHKGDKNLLAGDYKFDKKENIFSIINRVLTGDFREELISVTIPEGTPNKKIAEILSSKLPGFDTEEFLLQSKNKEGYLFPDTYFFLSKTTPKEVIETLEDNFWRKTETLPPDVSRNISDIVTMASILEGEAQTSEDRKIVAGILWKRLNIGMPLQVDATFLYINGKASSELTLDDLEIDSLYNTYVYKGLPPTPINNPGLESIIDAANPTESNFLFYLSDSDGNMHYAIDFEEHKRNKSVYLR